MLLHFGEEARARAVLERPVVRSLNPMVYRIFPHLRAVARHSVFRSIDRDLDLIWPSEAPPLDEEGRGLFKSYKVESGLPDPAEIY